jgi:autotransporter-associated beta strand protein
MKLKSQFASQAKTLWCLPTLALVFTANVHAESWNIVGSTPTLPNTVNFSTYKWNDALNWTPNSIPNAIDASAQFDINILFTGVTPNLQGTQQINLNVATIVGNLTLGDTLTNGSPAFNGNGFYNIANGTAGSLSFEASGGNNATLQKTVGSGTTDTISATVTLTSPLTADIRTGNIEIGNGSAGVIGRIGGSVGITRAAGVTTPVVPTTKSDGGFGLLLSNPGNTYTGDTVVEHGILSARLNGNILVSTNSNFGNASTAIKVGTAATQADANGTSILNFIAGSDAANYTVARDLDLSDVTAGQTARQTISFNGNLYNFNSAGGLNSNKLTLSGTTFIANRAGGILVSVLRSGMMTEFTGDITGTNNASDLRFNGFPSAANVDGKGSGTVRFSNLDRSFSATTAVISGTLVIDGVVGAIDAASPIGLKICNFNLGSGGNILGGANFTAGAAVGLDTSADTTRALFLEKAGNSYARNIPLGSASSTTATGVLTPTTGSTAIPAVYGLNDGATATDQSKVNVPNGFKIGGLNTSGTATFSGNITSGTMQVGNTNTNNTINVGINLALMSGSPTVPGGTVAFTGIISDTSNGTLPVRPSVTRVTVNQFRNHPNLDGNNGTLIGADGNPDTAANALIGTATGGTVILGGNNTYQGGTEVLGGTLTVNNTAGSGTGTGDVTVVSGAKLGGTGTVSGSATLNSGAGLAFTVNTLLADHNSFDITTNLTLLGTTAVTILDGIGAEIGTYTLATVGGTFTGTPLANPILPAGMSGTVSVVGNELRLNVTAVISADYIAWISTYPSITGLDRAIAADPDGDGRTNLQEYAFGLIPDSGLSVNPIVAQLNKTNGKFSYTRRTVGLPSPALVYTVETSTNLTSWATDATATQVVTSTVGDVQTVEVTLSGVKPLSAPALFVRVVAK